MNLGELFMSILTNTAVVNTYSFSVGPSIESTSSSNLAVIDITILDETVSFHKTNTPTYVIPGATVTITYSVTNISLAPIRKITIQDPIFTMPNITLSEVIGGSITNDILTFTLSLLNRILPGTTVTATVTLTIADITVPSSTLYDTTATATLTLVTLPETIETRTSKGRLEVNSAIISLDKRIFPLVDTLTAGNVLTFIIDFVNSGNVEATIASNQFSDTWSAGSLKDVACTDEKFSITGNRITNIDPLILPPHSTFTLIYSGITVSI